MTELLRKLSLILTARDKIRFGWLLVGFLLMSLLEVIGIASIMPFMEVVSRPEVIQENKWMRLAFEELGFSDERTFLIAMGVAVLLLLATSNGFGLTIFWVQQRVVWGSIHRLHRRLFRRYLYQRFSFFLATNSTKLIKQALSEVNTLARLVLLPLLHLIAAAFISTVIVLLLIIVDARLAATVIVVLGGTYVVLYLGVRRYLGRLGGLRFEATTRLYQAATEAFGDVKTVKVRGSEEFFLRRFAKASGDVAGVQPKFQVVLTSPSYLMQTLGFGGILLIVLYLLTVQQSVEKVIPILSLYALAGYRLMPSLQKIFSAVGNIRFNQPALDAIYEDMQLPDEAPPPSAEVPEMRFSEAIELRGIGFQYNPSEGRVLDGIDVTIPKNSSVAFVGPTGSGKTTLVDIIVGLLEPDAGELLVDRVPVTTENVRQWQRLIGYVSQNVVLFDDNVARNIAFGVAERNIDMERVRRVAQIAEIDEFICEEMADGYMTRLGERGVRLSGGQRQRIGLARALYHEPRLLVLDEATSALDGITEEAVIRAISELNADITVIMIAHRLSTVRDCDRVYLLDGGRVVAQGVYDTLMRESRLFRGMARVAT